MVATIAAEGYPCTFAIRAAHDHALRWCFLESFEHPPVQGVARALAERLHSHEGETVSYVFCERPSPGLDEMEVSRRTWTLLQHLHEQDPCPWPTSIPRDVSRPKWQYAFGGTAMFVLAHSPLHRLRRSRWAPTLTVFFQPIALFAKLIEDPAKMTSACRSIEHRLRPYDGVALHPELNPLDPAHREWKHFVLPDGNDSPIRPGRWSG